MAMLRAGQVYNGRSKEMKQEAQNGENPDFRGRGAPHLHVFMAMVTYCAALGQTDNKDLADA
eukprot:2039836-Pyramimonas_sp.AAC.1